MTYVGGIVVMFLFLVLVLEVANENSKSSTKYLIKSSFYISVCGSVLTILFSAVFIYLFNYEIFNDIDF
jgi:NADH:ubiquinone oxidoreductase subunit 6 (subunit J)